jgi:hypothetical protein
MTVEGTNYTKPIQFAVLSSPKQGFLTAKKAFLQLKRLWISNPP